MEYCAHARPDHAVQKKSSKLNSVTDSKQSNLEMQKKKTDKVTRKRLTACRAVIEETFPLVPGLMQLNQNCWLIPNEEQNFRFYVEL